MKKSFTRHDSRKKSWRKKKKETLSPKTRFRAFVRKVIANLGWLVDKPGKKSLRSLLARDETEVVLQQDKYLLFQEPLERKEEDLIAFANRLTAYKCFRKYTLGLKVSLLRRATYLAYNKSVVLMRQGMPLTVILILVKGNGIASREETIEGKTSITESNVREGFMSGEYPALYEIPHQTTLETEGPAEFIVFTKHNFLTYSKDYLKKQYHDINCGLKKFPWFDKITYFQRREYLVLSFISETPPNTILPLYEDTVGLTYFVLEGKCSVLQRLVLIRDPRLSYPGYKLQPEQNPEDPSAETFIVRACTISRRGIFGLGEEICRWMVLTDTECEFLVIPRYLLLKHGRNLLWERHKDTLNIAYPSPEFLLQQFNYSRKWARYKRLLTNSLSKNISGNNIHKVPLMARCNDLDLTDNPEIQKLKTHSVTGKFVINSKQFELYPYLKKLSDYLPKDEIL